MRSEEFSDSLEPVDEVEPDLDAEPTVADSLDDETLIDADLGDCDEWVGELPEIEDEEPEPDETVEDIGEIQLLQELGIDLEDADDLAALDLPNGLDDDPADDEAAA